jgi:SDR family mycofactocin-dependent oxidoreductase
LAEEGADIIAFDICQQLQTVEYPMSTTGDLLETKRLVEAKGSRILAQEADVRDRSAIEALVAEGLAKLGHIDIVVANAGIMPTTGPKSELYQSWLDSIDVMLTGVFNTVEAALPNMLERDRGGSIIIISSAAGLKSPVPSRHNNPGLAGYIAAKHGVVGLMRMYAYSLGRHSIRCNSLHPGGVDSPMVKNDAFARFMVEHPDTASAMQSVLPIELLAPIDISNAVAWLCSEEARYITGVALPIDAGFSVR